MPITIDLELDKNSVGLGNVDNTSDVNKPISSATQTALNSKQASGDYATNTSLTEGLATKQPTGDYATNSALTSGLATKQNTIAPLLPYDYWYETRFLNTNIVLLSIVSLVVPLINL